MEPLATMVLNEWKEEIINSWAETNKNQFFNESMFGNENIAGNGNLCAI